MNLFLSEFTNKVDKKGRISFPSIFRNALPKNNKNEIILYKSIKFNSIEGCNSKRINEIAERINKLDIFSDDQDDFATSVFSEIVPTNLDKEGRFLIPESLKKHANISLEATFIGQGHFFQIWEPNNFAKYKIFARKKAFQNRSYLKWENKTKGELS